MKSQGLMVRGLGYVIGKVYMNKFDDLAVSEKKRKGEGKCLFLNFGGSAFDCANGGAKEGVAMLLNEQLCL